MKKGKKGQIIQHRAPVKDTSMGRNSACFCKPFGTFCVFDFLTHTEKRYKNLTPGGYASQVLKASLGRSDR